MGFSSMSPFSAITLVLLISFSNPLATAQTTLSAYDIIQQYNFPAGILPKGVTSYELDISTGNFAAYFNQTCKFSVDSYELEYKSKITGVISKDRLRDLKGVSVKVLFLWLSIVEVVRDYDELQFSVGIASANFDVGNFYESPQCGCGFDCVKMMSHGLVDSSGFGE